MLTAYIYHKALGNAVQTFPRAFHFIGMLFSHSTDMDGRGGYFHSLCGIAKDSVISVKPLKHYVMRLLMPKNVHLIL